MERETHQLTIDDTSNERIDNKNIFICERHYLPNQISKHETRSSVIPGELPTLNLPMKSFQSPPSTPRLSSLNIITKRLSFQQDINVPLSSSSSSTVTSPSYKSFAEFKERSLALKLPNGWTMNTTSECFVVSFSDGFHMVPKFEFFVSEDLSFILRVFLWKLPANHIIFKNNMQSFKHATLSSFISSLTSFSICPGIDLSKFNSDNTFVKHQIPKIFYPSADREASNPFPLFQTEFSRSELCQLLHDASTPCLSCFSLHKKEEKSLKRKIQNSMEPAKSNAPISHTSSQRIKLTLQNIRLENKSLKNEIDEMKKTIASNNVPVNEELNNDMVSIFSNADQDQMPPFMKFFWDEQQKYLRCNPNGIRYHPSIIKFCLHLASKSPSAYDDLRFDEKTNTGFLVLPTRRRLRDYKNYIRPKHGFNGPVVNELKEMVQEFSDQERYVTIVVDEMKVQEDLVWDKHSGDLIGYVDLGDEEINSATLKNSQTLASHVLVFLVRSVVNPLKFSFANFATKDVTALNLFPNIWKAVEILEVTCKLKVIAVTSDGASSNRTFYKMLGKLPGSVSAGNSVVYKTPNFYADLSDERFLHIIFDQPHVIKTARNNLSHSSFNEKSSRLMWNDGSYII